MNNTEFIIRKDNIPKQYSVQEEYLNSQEILENNYLYILESMQKESFNINNNECSIFNEILYEDKVVGFATYMLIEELGSLALNAIYVLPEFRGNLLFLNEIQRVLLSNIKFSLIEPSHRLMEILYDNDLAQMYENILVSPFTIIIPADSVECTEKNIKFQDEFLGTNFYDMNLSATIEIDTDVMDEDVILYYSRLLDVDIQEYGADKKREEFNEDYFNKIKDEMLDNFSDLLTKIRELKSVLPVPQYTVESIVGVEPEFSYELQNMIDNEMITEERAREIQLQITNEFEEGYVLPESLLKRLQFLLVEDQLEKAPDLNMPACVYCNTPIDITDNYCDICGFSFKVMDDINEEYEEVEDALMDIVMELKKQGFSDEEIDEIITGQLLEVAKEFNISFDN